MDIVFCCGLAILMVLLTDYLLLLFSIDLYIKFFKYNTRFCFILLITLSRYQKFNYSKNTQRCNQYSFIAFGYI